MHHPSKLPTRAPLARPVVHAARKVKRRTSARKVAPRKAKRAYDIHTGQPTGREVQAMHRLQVLTERRSQAGSPDIEELRANPRGDVKDSHDRSDL